MAIRRLAWLPLVLLLATPRAALAYRPFDGTDADVADVGDFELELGPAHYYRLGKTDYLIAPGATMNLGIARSFELVVDFKEVVGLEKVPDESRVRLLDSDVQFKWLLRRGTVQGDTGLSIALEAGPLLPDIGGDHFFGGQANFIFSYRASIGAIHVDAQTAYSRRQKLEGLGSVILEGPNEWRVRPVAEAFVEHELGEDSTYSLLVGAIWRARDSFTLDLGVRGARVDGVDAAEVRLGFTWTLAVWKSGS